MEINATTGYRSEKTTSASSNPRPRTAAKSTSGAQSSAAGSLQRLDTFERSAARPFGEGMLSANENGLRLEGDIPSAGDLAVYEPDEGEKDGIDWEGIEQYVSHIDVTLDNADDIQRSVHHVASMYIAAKTSLQHRYADREDILSEKMSRLDSLIAQAKNRLVSSYQSSVGSFYERAGNAGSASQLGKDFSAAIDERFEQIESLAQEKGILDHGDEYSYSFLSFSLEAMSLNNWILDPGPEPSALKDLEAAGFVAKAATRMNPGEWSLMSEGELGIHLALQYMKMAHTLGHWNISEEMSSLLLGSFEAYMNRMSGGALASSKNTAGPYQYAVKQYQEHGDIRKSFLDSSRRYLDDSFFSRFIVASNKGGMSHATRYQLSISQFLDKLEHGSSGDILESIVGNGIYSMSAYA